MGELLVMCDCGLAKYAVLVDGEVLFGCEDCDGFSPFAACACGEKFATEAELVEHQQRNRND